MRIHRDRPSDAVRGAKAGPPFRGWPWQAAGFVEHLGRAARPALRPSPAQPPATANHGHLRHRVRTLSPLLQPEPAEQEEAGAGADQEADARLVDDDPGDGAGDDADREDRSAGLLVSGSIWHGGFMAGTRSGFQTPAQVQASNS